MGTAPLVVTAKLYVRYVWCVVDGWVGGLISPLFGATGVWLVVGAWCFRFPTARGGFAAPPWPRTSRFFGLLPVPLLGFGLFMWGGDCVMCDCV